MTILDTDPPVPAAATGEIAAPAAAPAGIPATVADLFRTASQHESAGRLAEADRLLAQLVEAAPEEPDVLHLAGIVGFRLGRRGEAIDLVRRSLALRSEAPLAWRNLGEMLRLEGRLDDALAAGRRAVALTPTDPVTLSNLALIHAERHAFDEAERGYEAAIAQAPNHAGAHFGLAEVLLIRGDFARGWAEYMWRFNLPGAGVNLPPGQRRIWDGSDLGPRRLLIVADQGYGDAIQFGRYLSDVLARCPDPVVACGRDLVGVMRQLGARTIVDRWEQVGEVDAFATLSGLPRIFGTRLDTIPNRTPYLHPTRELAIRWARRIAQLVPPGLKRIGLVWAGRPTHANDARRSATLAALAPLFTLPKVAFVSLQKGPRQADVGGYFGTAPLVSLGPDLSTWDDTMAAIAGLDAVVTVDTAVGHLAGALGRPVHLMLPHAGEWRWLLDRDDSPWYPTMRLHRQPAPGDWAAVANSLAAAITAL